MTKAPFDTALLNALKPAAVVVASHLERRLAGCVIDHHDRGGAAFWPKIARATRAHVSRCTITILPTTFALTYRSRG